MQNFNSDMINTQVIFGGKTHTDILSLSLTSSSLLHWLTLMVPATINTRDIANIRHPHIRYTNRNLLEAHDALDLVKTGTYFLIILMFEDASKCRSSPGSEVPSGEILASWFCGFAPSIFLSAATQLWLPFIYVLHMYIYVERSLAKENEPT